MMAASSLLAPIELATRDQIERRLLADNPALRAMTPADWNLIDRFKDGSFGVSLASFLLYSNGHNLRGRSETAPAGLLYHDGEVLFSVGLFRKTLDSRSWHLMVSAPRGTGAIARVDAFLRRAASTLQGICGESYVRHLAADQRDAFYDLGYAPIETSPWDPEAPSEDETLNHRLVRLADVVGTNEAGELRVRKLESAETKRYRNKTQLAYNRFVNFLSRNKLRFVMREYQASDAEAGERLVRTHFGDLINPVGSTPEDYLNLVRLDPAAAGPSYFGRMGFLEGEAGRLPLMLFIGERTGPDTVALYATFTRRSLAVLEPSFDHTGYTAAPQFCYVHIFNALREMGVEYADLGGSETAHLDRFKQQLGAREVPTYWVVRPA